MGRGEQLSVARPPGRVPGAPQARKMKNNRVEWYPLIIKNKNKQYIITISEKIAKNKKILKRPQSKQFEVFYKQLIFSGIFVRGR